VNVVFDYVKNKHIGNDAPTRSFYNLFWFLDKLGIVPKSCPVSWAKDFRGRIMLSRMYVNDVDGKDRN
jgi:hypothetical protein